MRGCGATPRARAATRSDAESGRPLGDRGVPYGRSTLRPRGRALPPASGRRITPVRSRYEHPLASEPWKLAR